MMLQEAGFKSERVLSSFKFECLKGSKAKILRHLAPQNLLHCLNFTQQPLTDLVTSSKFTIFFTPLCRWFSKLKMQNHQEGLLKTPILKDICTPIFTVALFTITRTLKQPKCPLTDEWKKMWYIYTMEYYSAMQKNEILPFEATQMDLQIIILSEVSQTEKDKHHMISLICGL